MDYGREKMRRLTKILFLVNKDHNSVFGERVRNLTPYLSASYDVSICYRPCNRLQGIALFVKKCVSNRPHILYVIDIGIATCIASIFSKLLFGTHLVLDTGDLASDMVKVLWRMPPMGVKIIETLENGFWKICDIIITRGSLYADFLRSRLQNRTPVFFLPDGVDTKNLYQISSLGLRQNLGIDNDLVIGTVGSIVWSDLLNICYGWEIVRTVALLKNESVKGIIIGDGNGLSVLDKMVKKYGIEDNIIFTGRIPHFRLMEYLSCIDICISTQTNDRIGNFRTTVKLPEYMACGKYILATRVGEAKLVLSDEMLVDYHGSIDPDYPKRLADRVKYILSNPSALKKGEENIRKAKEIFDYNILGPRLLNILDLKFSLNLN